MLMRQGQWRGISSALGQGSSPSPMGRSPPCFPEEPGAHRVSRELGEHRTSKDGASEHSPGIQQSMAKVLLTMIQVFLLPWLDFSSLNLPFGTHAILAPRCSFGKGLHSFAALYCLHEMTGAQMITCPNLITTTKPKSILPFLEDPLRLGFKHLAPLAFKIWTPYGRIWFFNLLLGF